MSLKTFVAGVALTAVALSPGLGHGQRAGELQEGNSVIISRPAFTTWDDCGPNRALDFYMQNLDQDKDIRVGLIDLADMLLDMDAAYLIFASDKGYMMRDETKEAVYALYRLEAKRVMQKALDEKNGTSNASGEGQTP